MIDPMPSVAPTVVQVVRVVAPCGCTMWLHHVAVHVCAGGCTMWLCMFVRVVAPCGCTMWLCMFVRVVAPCGCVSGQKGNRGV